jgi:hypothetical protein
MTLPFARPAPAANVSPGDGVLWWGVAPEVSGRLDQLGREAGATCFMVRLAAFAAYLAVATDREEIVFGTYLTNRHLAETQAMFGFFSNLTTIRLAVAHNESFRECLARVRTAVVETSSRAEVPYGLLSWEFQREQLALPEIRTIFAMRDVRPMCFGGLEVTPLRRRYSVMPWEFTFQVDRWEEADRCCATFDARKHDPAGVASFIAGYQGLAGSVCTHPERPLSELR